MIKRILKTIIPNFILKYREKKIIHKIRKQFLNKEKKEIFKEIYRKKLWSPESEKINYKYYSGIGSHYPELTNNYIDKVKEFLSSFSKKPNVIILHTIKGKGVKEFENDPIWHARKLQGKEIEIGKKRLEIK